MILPTRLHPPLLRLRQAAASVQRLPRPAARWTEDGSPLAVLDTTPLRQPDATSCGSSVLVMMRMLRSPGYARSIVDAADPAAAFGEAALATRRRTNALLDRSGHLQLPWPAALGTRPAALIRHLGGGWHNRVIDPFDPGRAYDAIVAAVASGSPVPLFIGEGSWMQHIVLVTAATPAELTIYDPARGVLVHRTREQFETGRLDVAGWPQPWLVILPAAPKRYGFSEV